MNEHNSKGAAVEKPEINENLIIGRNAVRELLRSGREIEKLFVLKGPRDGSLPSLLSVARERKIPVVEFDKVKMDSLAGGGVHQGVIAAAGIKEYCEVDDMLAAAKEKGEPALLVICDGIEDPQNLGALIRSAEGAGAHGVIIPKRHSAVIGQTVFKASAGAAEYMKIAKVPNIASEIERLKEKGIWIYAAETGGDSYDRVAFDRPCAIVMGSEGDGVSRLVLDKSDFRVSIPMRGNVNSLNVAAAGAVILFEAARQLGKLKN